MAAVETLLPLPLPVPVPAPLPSLQESAAAATTNAKAEAIATAVQSLSAQLTIFQSAIESVSKALKAEGPSQSAKTEESNKTKASVKKEKRPILKIETSDIEIATIPLAISSAKWNVKPGSIIEHVKAQQAARSPTTTTAATTLLDTLLNIDARARAQESSNKCLATGKTTARRCGNAVKARNMLGKLDELSLLRIAPGRVESVEKLEDFIQVAFCGRHHRSMAENKLRDWSAKEAAKKATAASPEVVRSPRVDAASGPPKQQHPAAKEEEKEDRGQDIKKESTEPSDTKIEPRSPQADHTDPSTPRSSVRSTPASIRNMRKYFHESRFYHNIMSPTVATDNHISNVMKQPLTETALKSGYIYVYRIPGERGFFKIGYTTVSVRQRIQQWKTQCGHSAEVVYPTTKEGSVRISNVLRVEQLVHAELKAYRYREEDCEGCGKNHVEWFKVSEELIRAVIAKWTAWIGQNPYGEVDGVWQLKEDIKDNVHKMSIPTKVSAVKSEVEFEPHVPVRKSTLVRSVVARAMG
ncbi:hypothetical protein MMC19_007634 [Ptychographa xylographoides]|nr:hypothetical protein [Ptychographa xylographoides]